MYPKQVSLFIPWTRAMVAGATVGKPDYGKKTRKTTHKRRKRRRRKHAKKET